LLLFQRSVEIPADSLSRVIAAVFRQTEYRRSLRRTLAEDIFHWIGSLFRYVESALDAHPLSKFLLFSIVLALIVSIAMRATYARRMRDSRFLTSSTSLAAANGRDPWSAAQAAASLGNYLNAAHLLYLAVLQALARSDRIVIESAKTVADYSRELRRSSPGSFNQYREFARIYEPIVWGSRGCDSRKFEELSRIASSLSGRSA
jgi:hypothetical protein